MGHLNQSGFQSRVEIVFSEGGSVNEFQFVHYVYSSAWRVFKCDQESHNLVGYLVGYIVGLSGGFAKGLLNGAQHKLNEWSSVRILISLTKSSVVELLPVTDNAFYREKGEYGTPMTEDEGLPESSKSSVAILKWVDELKFVVECTAGDEGMFLGLLQP